MGSQGGPPRASETQVIVPSRAATGGQPGQYGETYNATRSVAGDSRRKKPKGCGGDGDELALSPLGPAAYAGPNEMGVASEPWPCSW